MKKAVNFILAFVAPLTSAPTAWAIFAGITRDRTAIPMNDWVAGIGAVSILLVDIAAALLMTDSYYFKQSSLGEDERKMSQPLWWSFLILAVAISSEIFLSLVIVVVEQAKEWGVIVFPLMTLAGAFTVAARIDLTSREQQRIFAREEAERLKKEKVEKARQTRLQAKMEKEKAASKKKEEAERKEKAREAKLKELECKICGWQAESKKQLAGHMKAHPISEREPEPLFWNCKNCGTMNNREKKECRNCGEKK